MGGKVSWKRDRLDPPGGTRAEVRGIWRYGDASSGNHERLYEISWWFWDISVWTKLVRSFDLIQNWAASTARMHHSDSWVLPRGAEGTVPPRRAFFLISFQLVLKYPQMAVVFGSSLQIKNILLGRQASVWKTACGSMKYVTTGWSWGGGDWSPLIISPLKATFNGRPESDTAEMRNPFQGFLKGNDLNGNKRPLWVRRMGDIVDPKVSCQASSWLNAGPTRQRPGLNCCTGGGHH